jgi:hypothetical protein
MPLSINKHQATIGIAKAWLLLGVVMFALAGCTNPSTTIAGDALTEFEHSSRTPQEPRGR